MSRKTTNEVPNEAQTAEQTPSRRTVRRGWKKQAKSRLKKCYGMMVVLCLILAMLGLDYQDSLTLLKTESSLFTTHTTTTTTKNADGTTTTTTKSTNVIQEVEDAVDAESSTADGTTTTTTTTTETTTTTTSSSFATVITDLILGRDTAAEQATDQSYANEENSTTSLGGINAGHSSGVLAGLVNNVASGRILTTIYTALKTMSGSKTAATVLLVIFGLLFYALIWGFVFDVIWVTFKRFFLECRLYDHVPMKRFLFYFENKHVLKVVWTTVVCDIYTALWSLTIVGGFIKYYSYYLVPWILAENPGFTPKEAITLSRRMMNGHKWECFVLSLSFLPWKILSACTFGLVGIFFFSPYSEATDAEFYTYLRGLAKEKGIENADRLNDTYLFEYAPKDKLEEAYADVKDYIPNETYEPRKGVRGFIENVFGVTLVNDEKAKEYERIQGAEYNMKGFKAILAYKMYPRRLFTIPGEDIKFKKVASLNFDRRYSILSLIFIFFAVCFVGWLWEGSLHVIKDGYFPNRGVLHGPWLPIYGGGSVLILIFLNKLRTHPLIEFGSAIVLCGFVEYFTSLFLEISKGDSWWNYSGYFLNINGRVCAEGLLIFGLGGIAIVYFVAPLLDNLFRYIPNKIAIPIAVILLACFTGDFIYSQDHPNTGKGITDYDTAAAQYEDVGRITMAASPELDVQLPEPCLYELVD